MTLVNLARLAGPGSVRKLRKLTLFPVSWFFTRLERRGRFFSFTDWLPLKIASYRFTERERKTRGGRDS